MTRAEIRTCILAGAAAWLEAGVPVENRAWWDKWDRGGREFLEDDKRVGVKAIPYDPEAWLGRPLDGAERVAFSRELERMQNDGLVERVTHDRTYCTGSRPRTVAIRLLSLPIGWGRVTTHG